MKIVLTGGPSAGKTSVSQIVARQFCSQVYLVEEAASLLFRGGFPRKNEVEHKKHMQIAIYYVQRELENLGDLNSNRRILICDRGSLDGIAYWPTGDAQFLNAVNSSFEKEIARYDWILHLETSPSTDYQTNSLRIETNEEALVLDKKIQNAWKLHPQRFIIPSGTEFVTKINEAVSIINMILYGLSHQQIVAEVLKKKNADINL